MLTLRLLGPIEIRFGDRAIDAAGRDKGLTLLAFLAATAGRHYAREDLADLFWPGMSRERGLHNLRQTLLRLRGLLTASGAGPAGLLTRRSTVAFDRHMDCWLDLQAFAVPIEDNATLESLERRAALYRGPFMADLACDIGERFEQWVADRRAEYQITALALESRLAAHYERDGRLERAMVHAQRCIALEPWNESGQRLQLRLLALTGHPEAALSHFRALRESLRRELGAEVEAATLALAESIRRGSLAPAEAVNVPAPVERRQVTVLDCGLACGDEDDPEALAAVLAEPCRLARTIIERQGGSVAEQRPGRVTAFFGWPTADERAVSQAARAACGLERDLAAAHPRVARAIGIHSGLMLIREGDNDAWHVAEQALRLRLSAPAGTAVVSDAVARSLRERFELRRLRTAGGHPSRWRLIAEREPAAPAPRAEAYPLQGRMAELVRLAAAWRDALAQGPRMVVLSGEAGIGKSRLVREFLRANGLGGASVHCGECEPLRADSPLFPLQRMLRRALSLPAGADAACARARLGDFFTGRMARAGHWLVSLLCDDEAATSVADFGADQRAQLVDALCRLLIRVLQPGTRGALLVLEDAHWADATTLEVLDALTRGGSERILVLLTARALPSPPPHHAEVVDLTPLEPAAARELARLAGGGAAVVRAAEGVPLFIVELARMQVLAAAEDDAVPANLRDLLAARLAQAGPDKALLQAAAVIGRSFEIASLRGLVMEVDGPLEQAVDRLAALNLLEREAGSARFTHALLQRAAYESLPRTRRAELHRRYAEQLQGDSQRAGLNAPDVLAWHLSAGGLPGEAATWWLRAAQRASRLSAYAETAQLAERALAALEAAPERAAHGDTELAALLLGAYARVALGGYFDPKAQQLYGRARERLPRQEVDPHQTFGVLRGYWLGASSRASHREARLIAEEMVRIADAAGIESFRGIARYLVGNSALWLGQFADALAQLEAAVDILRRVRPDAGVLLAHDQDFEATATGYLGWAHWYLGRGELALDLGQRAVSLARTRGHLLTLMHTATSFCSIGMGSGAAGEVLAVAEESVRLAGEHGLSMWADIGRLQQCWARSALGREVDIDAAEQALERLCAAYPGGAAGFQVIAGHIYLAHGERERAGALIAALRQSLRSTEAGIFAADLHLLEGELAHQLAQPRRAARAFLRAARLAQAQGSPQLQAQAVAAVCGLCPRRTGCAGSAHCERLRRHGVGERAAALSSSEMQPPGTAGKPKAAASAHRDQGEELEGGRYR